MSVVIEALNTNACKKRFMARLLVSAVVYAKLLERAKAKNMVVTEYVSHLVPLVDSSGK